MKNVAKTELDRLAIKYQIDKKELVFLTGMMFNLSTTCTLLKER